MPGANLRRQLPRAVLRCMQSSKLSCSTKHWRDNTNIVIIIYRIPLFHCYQVWRNGGYFRRSPFRPPAIGGPPLDQPEPRTNQGGKGGSKEAVQRVKRHYSTGAVNRPVAACRWRARRVAAQGDPFGVTFRALGRGAPPRAPWCLESTAGAGAGGAPPDQIQSNYI